MVHTPCYRRVLWLFAVTSVCLLVVFLSRICPKSAMSVNAMPVAQDTVTPTPTQTPTQTPTPIALPGQDCPWPGSCPVARYYDYQPTRSELRPTFNAAAQNTLSGVPVYPTINDGVSPNVTPEVISADRPFPSVLLRAIAAQESKWKQFADNEWTDPDGEYFCTLVTFDCGYGIMQQTSNMGGGSWFDPTRVSKELNYALGTGVGWLIDRWNYMGAPPPFTVGGNDHTMPEDWYHSVVYYNGWSECNEPNRNYPSVCGGEPVPRFDPWRHPYGEGGTYMPYQEAIWGWMANPSAFPSDGPRLWRSTRVAWVPRGIWGLFESGNWRPSPWSPRPVFTLLPNIHVESGIGPEIILQNTQGDFLAADIALYNADGSFNRWWLGCPDDQDPAEWYVRVDPYSPRTINVADAFHSDQTFSGYARVSASDGLEVSLRLPPAPPLPPASFRVFLPNLFVNTVPPPSGSDILVNGGLEEFENGKPDGWAVTSGDNYPLAGSTWFQSGHYGAYLGGYDLASDLLGQTVHVPGDAQLITFVFSWYMTSEDHMSGQYDWLKVRLLDQDGNIIKAKYVTNLDEQSVWHTEVLVLPVTYADQDIRVFIKGTNDSSLPTNFFVDNVGLWIR